MIYGNEIDQIDYFHSIKRRKRFGVFLSERVWSCYELCVVSNTKSHLAKRRNKNLLTYKEGNIKQYSMIIFNRRKSRLYIDLSFQTHSLIQPSQLYSDYNEQTCYNQFYMRYGR